jgi:hypothetical protein
MRQLGWLRCLNFLLEDLSGFLHVHTYNVHMDEVRFIWDPKKDRANIKKHGVSFNEAATVFLDEQAIQFSIPITPKRKIDSSCLELASN